MLITMKTNFQLSLFCSIYIYKTLIALLLYYSIVVKVLPDIHQTFLLSLAGETKQEKTKINMGKDNII